MDFHNLTRKELQTLCKKNNIPANITNVAMAQALTDLHQVEGLDELVNRPVERDAQGFQEDKVIATPDTRCRTSTRRKALRGAEGIEQQNKDVNVAVTPAVTTSRRRATAISTRKKTKAQMPDDEKNGGQGKPTMVPRTPAVVTTMTRANNTRRSVRLLEKNLCKMSLMDTEDVVGLKIDMSEDTSYISQQTEDLAEMGKRPSMQMVSTAVSEKTDEFEVTSQEKNTEYELGSDSENEIGASLQAEPREGLGKFNSLEAERHDLNLKMNESSQAYNYSNAVCDGSDFDRRKPTGKAVPADNRAETEMFVELEDSCDFTKPENKKCLETKNSGPFESPEDAMGDVAVAASSLPVELPDDASKEVTGQDIVGLLPMSSVSKTNDHGVNDSAYISALSNEVSGDASMEVTDQDVAASTVEMLDETSTEATGQDIAASFPMSSVSDDSLSLKESVAHNTDNHNGNDSADISALAVDVSEDATMEATYQDAAGLLPMPSACNDLVSLKELIACNTDNLQCNDLMEISDVLMSLPCCHTNTLVESDVIPDESVILEHEFSITVETMKHKSPITEVSVDNIDEVMAVAPIYEQKTSGIPIQSIVVGQSQGESHFPAQSEPKDVADEPIPEGEIEKNLYYMMKENCEYQKMSIRELKKMLKNLKLDGKSNNKSNVTEEVDRKRTELQALPENQMTVGETQNDG